MPRNLENLVRRSLARFISGRVSLRTFNRWFVPATWDIANGPASLRELVRDVKMQLYEYDNQHLTLEELQHKLSLILRSYSNASVSANWNFKMGADRLPDEVYPLRTESRQLSVVFS
jgi:hypothetical protein